MPSAPWTDPRFLAWVEAQRRWEELSRASVPFPWGMQPPLPGPAGPWNDPYYARSVPAPENRMMPPERGYPQPGRSPGSAPPPRGGAGAPTHAEARPKVQEISLVASMIVELVRGIAHQPDDVWVTELEGTNTTVIEVHVTEADHGRMVGRSGRVASALREVLYAMGGKYQRRYSLQFIT